MSGKLGKKLTFVVIWEFRVKRGKRRAFEKAYGPLGEWAQLFSTSTDYVGTQLIRDRDTPLRYLTLDSWTSRQAYLRFKKENQKIYEAIDAKCQSLTTREKLIGEFDRLENQGSETEDSKQPSLLRDRVSEPAPTGVSGTDTNHADAGQIRRATPADITAILDIEREHSSAAHWPEATYRRIFSDGVPPRLTLVFEGKDRRIQGFALARLASDECELENVAVTRKQQCRGIATKLLRELIVQSKVQRAARISLEVRESNNAARRLYENCGFALAGRRRAYYANPAEDAVIYTLQL